MLELGAVPYCLTNVPQTCMSHQCSNPLFGATGNPHKPEKEAGGSSGVNRLKPYQLHLHFFLLHDLEETFFRRLLQPARVGKKSMFFLKMFWVHTKIPIDVSKKWLEVFLKCGKFGCILHILKKNMASDGNFLGVKTIFSELLKMSTFLWCLGQFRLCIRDLEI